MNRLAALRIMLMIILLTAAALSVASCTPAGRSFSADTEDNPVFRPPTAVIVPTPSADDGAAVLPTASDLANQSDENCVDQLIFVSDLTIPDGTSVSPQSTMDKRWEVENSGSCNWNASYRIRLIAGSELGTQKEQALYPARSGTRAAIRILFQAPAEPGEYRSAWQAFNPQGEPFGDPFFIDFIVSENP